MNLIDLCERGVVPDLVIRAGIRRLCARRLRDEHHTQLERADQRGRAMLETLRASPIAIETDAANSQHYELPPRFFELCLGRQLKYSACYFHSAQDTLEQAEEAMLALYAERAELADGQRILELGCGWGSLTLWMAERYPAARITAVSNSAPQRGFILAKAAERGLPNIDVITCDINDLDLAPGEFDRAVSIEMFEHMRNYRSLLGRIAATLAAQGKLFVHIFCHRYLLYPFEADGNDNWMGRHFFTGGLMPAADTLLHFAESLHIEQRWLLSGQHYQHTANRWLQNQDHHRDEIHALLASACRSDDAARLAQRWRMFWMACAELFGYRDGNEWGIAHYRFSKR